MPAHTLRAWERRYGLFRPARTSGGYRFYDDEIIQRIRAMQALVASGLAPRQAAARVAEQGLGTLAEDLTGLFKPIVDAAIALDAAEVARVLDERFSPMHDPDAVIQQWLLPALDAIGRAWASGELPIGGEHLVAHAVTQRLSAAYEAAGRPEGRPVIIGAPAGVHHDLGLLSFAVVARRAGLPTVFLGADVPSDAWLQAVQACRAAAVVTAAPRRVDAPRVAALAEALASGGHSDVPVCVGGRYQHLVAAPCVALGHELASAAAAVGRLVG